MWLLVMCSYYFEIVHNVTKEPGTVEVCFCLTYGHLTPSVILTGYRQFSGGLQDL